MAQNSEDARKRQRDRVRMSRLLKRVHEELVRAPKKQVFDDLYNLIYDCSQKKYSDFVVGYGRLLAMEILEYIRICNQSELTHLYSVHEKLLLCMAPYDFDSYLLYTEWRRKPEAKFYLPRRKVLKQVSAAIQGLADNELDLLCISLPPGTGKTTEALFALTWFAGRDPDGAMLTASHNSTFIRGAYDECLRMMNPLGEYRWHKVFNKEISSTNAKDCLIDIEKDRRFKTFQFTTVGSGNAGVYRAKQLLYCDDLVPGMEVALSKERLDKLWEIYVTDLRQRKIGKKCKELHIATRWSVHDIIGRLERENENNQRAMFINIPALNAEGKSNFDYPYDLGYTTEKLLEQREVMGGASDPSWKALYMGEPIEREGLLYHPEDIRRFYELPDREPDAIIAVCDTKDRGTDYCVMPVGYVYGQDHYIAAAVCTDALPEITEPLLVETLLKHRVQMCRFESNSAGGHIATSVHDKVREKGGRTEITAKYTTQNKETKIIVNSAWVKEHCLFLDESLYNSNSDYGKMIKMLFSYTTAGRNKHDDVPDALAMYALFAQSFGSYKVVALERPF